ncbi:UNVERIFIED_CONTAM: hypothetical protein NCL1_44157 [Trichonephila clavipes]
MMHPNALMLQHYRDMVFCDFKAGLNQDECVQWLKLAFDDESPCCETVLKGFKEFTRGRNSFQEEEHRKAVVGSNP